MKLLLISNSTMAGEEFLEYPKKEIANFLKPHIQSVVFIPYAGISIAYDLYNQKVRSRFAEIGYSLVSVTEVSNPVEAIQKAQAIVVGGGNTFRLLELLYKNNLIEPIRKKVQNNTPFIGWSAGANVACPTIATTNDMPVVAPPSFNALGLVTFQINPHYNNTKPDGHAGETRDDRIAEYLEINKDMIVVGLREGTMLKIEKQTIKLIGNCSARIFEYGKLPRETHSLLNFITE